MNRIAFVVLAAFVFIGELRASQNAFPVRDGVAAYAGMDDKGAPVATFMRNQKVQVLEKYTGQAGKWSKVQLSKGHFAYIESDDLADKPHELTPEEISAALVARLKGQPIDDLLKQLGPPNQVLDGNTRDVRIYMWQGEKVMTWAFATANFAYANTVSKKTWAMLWVQEGKVIDAAWKN